MRRSRMLLAVALPLVLSLVVAAPALGASVVIENPDAAYLAETTKIPPPSVPDGTVFGSTLSDGVITATFSQQMRKTTLTAVTWGLPGEVEEPHPAYIYAFAGGFDIQLSQPVAEFGVEAISTEVGTPVVKTLQFTMSLDGQPVGSVTRTITRSNDPAGGRLFAIKSDVPFDRVTVSGTDYPQAIAQIRYALPSSPPISTPASSGWSVALLVVAGLGTAFATRKRFGSC
jgi:hypothetical protein